MNKSFLLALSLAAWSHAVRIDYNVSDGPFSRLFVAEVKP
jgi:hypothetical protein